LKIDFLGLELNKQYFYIEQDSIVKKVIFNNRTFYSKYEEYKMPISSELIEEHQNNQISLAIPLVENDLVDYLVIEYQQEDWKAFYSLVKHMLKSLNISDFKAYRNVYKELFQIFIPQNQISLEEAYKEVEGIKSILEFKSKKSYKIYPNKNLPKNFNIITLATQKA